MTTLVSPKLAICPTISRQQLESLARTFDAVDGPVWIEDRQENCLYRNNAAEYNAYNAADNSAPEAAEMAEPVARFDLIDDQNRLIGRICSIR